ncbi:type I phosphomannose isomerase catalytic subunit [Marixanthomonas ophiurae]|uniref:Phosphohexomutase n=1 Tax=Marixanthomonas ophiurae TaxID=387659 RepID=A0A3E1Q684_9FLAO|nr:type I phosphomannose isomerase catalytic subunit [Marixanthomonas ophiurae]RFN57629.1 mannose-6-phosphate isomerase [Marixanthomonas ophiurae]
MNKTQTLYPLKFIPILKEKVWGGNKLSQKLHKNGKGKIGESWEVSGLDDDTSIIANGIYKNETIVTVINKYKETLLGNKVYTNFGSKFPLLFKFIDAQEDLSVQVHPGDKLAKNRHNSFGKTEMWYIVEIEKDARLILGFNKKVDEKSYLKKLSEGNITDILHSEKVIPGDAFFIAPGTIHAIGAGVLLAEIQQTSDITYRIYDWDRPDINGEMRDLHTDLAKDAINYEDVEYNIAYQDVENSIIPLKSLQYFETNKLNITTNFTRNLAEIDSFVVYMCTEGEAIIETESTSETVKKGETVLIPACFTSIKIKSTSVTLLETYIP